MSFPQLELETYKGTKAIIHTTLGDLSVQLFDTEAPRTVENFVKLSEKGYYNGIIFHRIIPDFMIQGGDPTGTGMGGTSIFGEKFEDEFSENLFNLRGALSMANAGPNTNGSQFFVVQKSDLGYPLSALTEGGWPEEIAKAYVENGGTPHLDGRHTVFGQLTDAESYAVLDKMDAVATDAADRPLEEIIIESVEIKKFVAEDAETRDKKHALKIGDVFKAKVIGIQTYGVFVSFDTDEKHGLVHISELRSGFVTAIQNEIQIGDKMDVMVIDIDEFSGKVSLSHRALEENPEKHQTTRKHYATNSREKIGFKPLEKALPTWIRENEDYLKDLENTEN